MVAWTFAVILLSLAISTASAQTIWMPKGPPSTVAAMLRQHDIALDTKSLVRALQNPDPEVRSLSAAQLGSEKVEEALPFLLSAMGAEKTPVTKVDLAFAVAQLGDKAGFSLLKSACHDRSESPDLRLRAASDLRNLRRNDCIDAVEGLAVLADSPDSRAQAVSLLSAPHDVTGVERQKINTTIVKALFDPAPNVRVVAANALVLRRDNSAASYLEKAITEESDPAVRSEMESDLQRLRGR